LRKIPVLRLNFPRHSAREIFNNESKYRINKNKIQLFCARKYDAILLRKLFMQGIHFIRRLAFCIPIWLRTDTSPFGSGNFSSLDWYFSQILLPNMIYLYKIQLKQTSTDQNSCDSRVKVLFVRILFRTLAK
jgi:hypothetical protein